MAPDLRPIRAEHARLDGYLRASLTADQLARPLLVSFTQWDFAVAAVAETVVTLHDMGSEVSVALWSDVTPLRDVGWQAGHSVASMLLSGSMDQGARRALVAAGVPELAFVDSYRPWRPIGSLPTAAVTNRAGIRAMTYRDAPVGRGILEVPPHADVPATDDFLWPRRYVDAAARSYAFAYDQTARLIEERGSTAVFVYNGRFLHDSAVAAAAAHFGLPVLSYDTGGLETDFDLTIDATHDWSALQDRMRAMYSAWPVDERDELGGSWFADRASHAEQANLRFTGAQEVGRGIAHVPGTVVTYFSSSGDEIAELDLDWADYFDGQAGALRTLAEECRAMGFTLIVRTHPHKRFKPAQDVEDWHAAVAAAEPHLHLDEHSSVDSYTLMRQSDVVVTYGSTTGVEACYAERPVIVMGPSAYDELGCAVRVGTREDLRRALVERRPARRSDAVPYGLMMKRRGFVYNHVERTANGGRSLAGVPIAEPRPLARHVSHAMNRFTRWRLTR